MALPTFVTDIRYLVAYAANAAAPIAVVAFTWSRWMGNRRKQSERRLVERSEHIAPILREFDISCSTCGYNLRGHTKGECPECAAQITLAFTVHPSFSQTLLLWLSFCIALLKPLSLVIWASFYITRNANVSGISLLLQQTAMIILFVPMYVYCAARCFRARSLELPLNITHPSCLLLVVVLSEPAVSSALTLITISIKELGW